MANLSRRTPIDLGAAEGLSFPPGELSEPDITPPPTPGTVTLHSDTAPADSNQGVDGDTACETNSMTAPSEATDTFEKERIPTASTSQDAEGAVEQPESLLCMLAPPVSTPPCLHVVEWASVQAIVRQGLQTYDPLKMDAAVGNITVDRRKVASGIIDELAFSNVIAAVYKGASDLEMANDFAMLMNGAVELDPTKDMIPGLREHVKHLPLYGRIAGASPAWVLEQIESEDVSEVIGMHITNRHLSYVSLHS